MTDFLTTTNLHINEGAIPKLKALLDVDGRAVASVAMGGNITGLSSPRDLRTYADALIEIADEACRQEDELQDEPLSLDLDKFQAIKAVKAAAHRSDDGTELVHCFMGGIGADWLLDDVVAAIEIAQTVRWCDHLLGHDLVVEHSERTYHFDVRRAAVYGESAA